MKNVSQPHTVSPLVINLFFLMGLLSAFAFRVLVVLAHFNSQWFRPVWYLGVVGYFGFFLYRYLISRKRRQAISDFQLIAKLESGEPLSEVDREVVVYILKSLVKSRENVNYMAIFILSVLAVMADLALSIF